MGTHSNEPDYESLRAARISENKARMEMLGLRRAKEELNDMAAAAAPARRPWAHKQYANGPPRRSPRLNGLAVQHKALPLSGCLGKVAAVTVEEPEEDEDDKDEQQQQQQMAVAVEEDHNAVLVAEEHIEAAAVDGEMVPAPHDSDDEGMGDVYDPVDGEAPISAEEIAQRQLL